MVRSVFAGKKSAKHTPKRSQAPWRNFRPRLEDLEDRITPTTQDFGLQPATLFSQTSQSSSASAALAQQIGGSELSDAQREAIQNVVRGSTNQIWFEKNVGQFAPGVRYGFRTTFGAMLVYDDHLRLISRQNDDTGKYQGQQVVDFTFTGSANAWTIVPGGASATSGNYVQADGTVLHPPIYNEVTLRNVYNGVDLRLYAADKAVLEFDWIVARASDYGQIRIQATGQDGILYSPDGSITLDLRYQDLALKMPETYQVLNGAKHQLVSQMVAGDRPGEIRYQVSGDIVGDAPLVIDPNVQWGTYFDLNDTSTANAFDSYLFAIAANSNGVYCVGWVKEQITNGSFSNYMEVNAGFSQGTATNQIYVYRLSNDGLHITAWTSTGIAGSTDGSGSQNGPTDLELFPDGRVLISIRDGTIQVYSADLGTRHFTGEPTVNFSTVNSIAIVDDTHFYLGGLVTAAIPTGGVGQIANGQIGPDSTFGGSSEGAIVHYTMSSPTGPTIAADWATYVGGDAAENFTSIALTPDKSKLVFAVHSTAGTLASYSARVNPVDNTLSGTSELLVGVLNNSGQTSVWSNFDVYSFLGGSSTEGTGSTASCVVTTVNNGFWVGGTTASTDLPGISAGVSAQDTKSTGDDAFVSFIPINGSAGSGFRSTYMGGTTNELMGGIAYDPFKDRLLIFGTTTSGFPTLNTTPASDYFDNSAGGGLDIFIATVNGALTLKDYATYIGGNGNDYLGDTGLLLGQGHVYYSPDTDLTYLATTLHSTDLPTSAIGIPPGKDKTKSNSGNDVHVIFSFNINIFDYGDGPVSYEGSPADPAAEAISHNLTLGTNVSAEFAAKNGATATDDDFDDGVSTLPALNFGDTSYSVTVSVFNNTGGSRTLQGWIDFNRNGIYEAGERTSATVNSSASQQSITLTWSSLPPLNIGQSYLRLRLTDNVLTDNGGTAIDERSISTGGVGEVEEYGLTIVAATAGDRVWYDIDGDGVQDAGEPGIAGANVTLTWAGPDGILGNGDDQTFSTTTGANGIYNISNLPKGNYAIAVSGQSNGLTSGSPGNPSTFTLTAGQTRTDIDLGFRGTSIIGDRVWEDLNGNGIQDGGEPGVNGASVTLTWAGFDGILGNGDDITYPVATTAGAGAFSFANLPSGTYQALFTPPGGYTITAQNQGGNPALDSDPNPGTGLTASFALGAGATNNDVDAGLYRAVSVGDRVWYDVDGDGVQDAGEPGIAGASVTLTWAGPDGIFGNGDDQTFSTTTGANGIWTISTLPPGSYNVAVTGQSHGLTTPTNSVSPFTLVSNVSRTDIDLGFRGTGVIGDFVWNDLNANGIQDGGEPGLAGATVTLTWLGFDDAVGGGDDFTYTVVATPGSGAFSFANLPSGNFRALFTPPAGGVLTLQGQGGNPALDSDPNPGTGLTPIFALGVGATNNDIDAGVLLQADLSLTKSISLFTDTDGSGNTNITPGDIVLFTITLSNAGPNAATGVGVGDLLPTGYSNPTNISNSGGFSGGIVSWSGLTVASGGSITLTFRATVNATGNYTNVAEVTASDQPDPDSTPDSTPDNNPPTEDDEASTTPVITPKSDLSLTKIITLFTDNDGSGNGNFTAGDTVLFTITVTNAGPNDATGVGIGDLLPTGFSGATNISNGGSFAGGIVSWSGLTITSGGSLSLSFRSTLNATGNFTNVAEVTASNSFDPDSTPDPTPDNNPPTEDDEASTTVTLTPKSDLSLTKTITLFTDNDGSGNGNITPGDTVLFTITVTNAGPNDATGVGVGDFLPPGYTGAANISNGGTFLGGIVSWSGLTIVSGGSLTLTFQTTVNATGSYTNVAEVTASNSFDPDSTPDPTPDNNPPTEDDEATATPIVTPKSDLSLSKIVTLFSDNDGTGAGNITAGDTIMFTITVNNAGPNTVTGVGVGDLLPSGFSGATNINNGGTFVGGIVSWTNLTIPSGGSLTLTFLTTVNSTGNYFNVAEVTASNSFDPDSTPDSTPDNNPPTEDDEGSVTVPVTPKADLSIFKTDGQTSYVAGAPISYTITVTNNGPSTVTSLFVNDPVPGNIQGATFTPSTGSYNSGTGAWTGLNLASGQSITLTLSGTISLSATGNLVNTATVSPPPGTIDPNPGNDSSTDTDTPAPSSAGDRIWYDVNGDGVQDPGEPGIAGATVTLTWFGPDGNPGGGDDQTFSTTTGANGIWSIGNLPAGNYSVAVSGQPNGLTNPNPTNPSTFSLTVGQNRTDIDLGFRGNGVIGDFVWNDQDGDGIQDPGEPGLPGIGLTLTWLGFNGVVGGGDDITYPVAVTSTGGLYSFANLPSGNFSVDVNNGSLPTNVTLTGGGTDPRSVSLTPGQNRSDIDFGYRGTAAINSTVWYDIDGGGTQNGLEPGIPGATVNLLWAGPDGILGTGDDVTYTTTTNASGDYSFVGLPVYGPDDNYRVTVIPPAIYTSRTYDLDGVGTPNVATFLLGASQTRTDVDFGYRGSSVLGGDITVDINNDGLQNGGDPAYTANPVTVELYFAGGTTPIASTTTNTGSYSFVGLAAGSYELRFVKPANTTFTLANQGGNDAVDSDANQSTGRTGPIAVGSFTTDTSWDAGLNVAPNGPTNFNVDPNSPGIIGTTPTGYLLMACGEITFNISGVVDPNTPDNGVGFTYQFDYNNDGVVDASSPPGQSGSSYTFTTEFDRGTWRVRVRAVDQFGNAGGWVSLNPLVDLVVPTVQTYTVGGVTNLIINGTANPDAISVNAYSYGNVAVQMNGTNYGTFAVSQSSTGTSGHIIISTCDAADLINLSGYVSYEVHGGAGNDTIYGGSGHDVIYGDAGNDYITAGIGNDVVVGGLGKDTMQGGNDADILIGGSLNKATYTWSSLRAISDAWFSNPNTSPPPASLAALRSSAVTNDPNANTENDLLMGNLGKDAFIYRNAGVGIDTVSDYKSAEYDALLFLM